MNHKVLIIGDIMLDEYIYGEVDRISPEAPVPIVKLSSRKMFLGGAANVAAGVAALCVEPILIGVIGNDKLSGTFDDIASQKGIKFVGVCSDSRSIIIKTRIIGNGHQLVRYDDEETQDIDLLTQNRILEEYVKYIKEADIVIISDYKKGVCTTYVCHGIISIAKKYNKRVMIDPKQSNWERYRGAYLIKPNLKELYSVLGSCISPEQLEYSVRELMDKNKIENMLLTKSQDGMSLFSNTGIFHCQAQVEEVYDVSGAGDTVIATMAVFLANGYELREAVKIANMAAGIAVCRKGTYVVAYDELLSKVRGALYSKKINMSEISKVVTELKNNGKKIVFTNGCFDLLHAGHIALLKEAKELGDILIVGVNSDASVKRLKGKHRPINNEIDRAVILSALEVVDIVVIFEEDTPYELIKQIVPDVLVKGGDYTVDEIVGSDIAGETVVATYLEGKSSTEMLKRGLMNCEC